MENRNGLIVDLRVEPATGYAEPVGALAMLDEPVPNQVAVTLGADAGYDTSDFASCRERGITHVAQTRDQRRSAECEGRPKNGPAEPLASAALIEGAGV